MADARTAQELADECKRLALKLGDVRQDDGTETTREADAVSTLHAAIDHLAALASQAEPTMSDAIAAGDGTLHGAIDYWQQRALKAEQSEDGIPAFALRREAIVRAWNDIPESLRCHPWLKALYRALSGATREQS